MEPDVTKEQLYQQLRTIAQAFDIQVVIPRAHMPPLMGFPDGHDYPVGRVDNLFVLWQKDDGTVQRKIHTVTMSKRR